MIRRKYFFIFLTVGAAILGLWVAKGRRAFSPAGASVRAAPLQLPGGPLEPADVRWEERRRKLKWDPDFEWKLPIDFFGRVVDEKDQPIAGATITFQWNDYSPAGSKETATASDALGAFSLTGRKGNGLSVRITKEGYYTPTRGNQFRFENARFWDANYHEPDANKPVVFHLRKRGQAESLVVGSTRPRVKRDGTPFRIDLLATDDPVPGEKFEIPARPSPDGQLEIAAWIPENLPRQGDFSWRRQLKVIDGGLLEHNEEFPFDAPEVATSPWWKSTCRLELPGGGRS